MNNSGTYGVLVKAINDESFRNNLKTDFYKTLSTEGITDADEVSMLQIVLSRVIGYDDLLIQNNTLQQTISNYQVSPFASDAYRQKMEFFMTDQLETTRQTSNGFKSGLVDSLHQIKQGFRSAMIMYTVAFYVGIGLILAAVVFAWLGKGSLLPIAFAGLGVADLIAYFITKPPLELQKSRANLAQLQTAYYNWFIDLFNWNAVASGGETMINQYKIVSEMTLKNTERTMKMIEDYCEIASNTPDKTPGTKSDTAASQKSSENEE
ncbi:MAG: hypothetical protein CVU14_08420 [Bacteroidetes bacterium HGW-Bacteroidetes-9]|jgi:hypothetical protein|nr:MAG: hypothetical protein CVU14_08420 [Bacteroidetes bacterium HGW-Bacteroidetes-9]